MSTVETLRVEASVRRSLSTEAARNLTTTTKSKPQMRSITTRWLLRMLPWVDVAGGTYRVNRRLNYTVGDGRLSFVSEGADIRVVPAELRELPLLRDFDDLRAGRSGQDGSGEPDRRDAARGSNERDWT